MALPPMKPLNMHFEIDGKKLECGGIDIKSVSLCAGADPDRPVYQVIEAEVPRCKKCRSTKGWRVLLFWRIIHNRRCPQSKLWGDIKRGHLTGCSMGGHVKARRQDGPRGTQAGGTDHP